MSADAVYKLDYDALVDEHLETGADVTMVTTEVEPEDAGRYGVVQAGGGRVHGYVYKPDEPDGNLISNEVFVFRRRRCWTPSTSSRRRTPSWRTSATGCCRGWWSGAARASTASSTTGATWGRSRPTGRRTPS